ncbi:hypothetical protein BJ998_007177 [Kutzneria kofuensis]|uniref:Exo-alpha-sialidase n=1 Tax=Kutzneria kofuensis TaxID=103725 RepID=A0A7W9KNU3_9PSEU|nr:hypothetical protein [Kutzneria kofuensis]
MGLTLALAVPATEARAPQWLSMGPNASGGFLAFTPAAPSRLYVLPDGARAVFRSDDHGITWAPPTPLPSQDVRPRRVPLSGTPKVRNRFTHSV